MCPARRPVIILCDEIAAIPVWHAVYIQCTHGEQMLCMQCAQCMHTVYIQCTHRVHAVLHCTYSVHTVCEALGICVLFSVYVRMSTSYTETLDHCVHYHLRS